MAIFLFLNCAAVSAGERFTDNGDGTITDNQLKVMWAAADNQGDINWKEAGLWVRYTFPFTLEKRYSNWRLPTLSELESLYVAAADYDGYETDCGQWVRIVQAIKISCGWLWTSETQAITARVFNFNRGVHYTDRMVHRRAYRVLPVRSLE
jgi:hypothetical protein